MDLLSLNASSRFLRERRRLIVCGKCLEVEWPDLIEGLGNEAVVTWACPERDHINVISLKLASILARVSLKELTILTVDGSPHCVQLHHAVEEAIKVTKSEDLSVRHLVCHGDKLIEVSPRAVKVARYLSKVERLLRLEEERRSSLERE